MTIDVVDQFAGIARLQWSANHSTCLADLPVVVKIRLSDAGWTARGALIDEHDADGLNFLCEFDPRFDLRFEDGSVFAVTVDLQDTAGRFTLEEDIV